MDQQSGDSSEHTPGPWWVTDYGVRDSGGYICATTRVSGYAGQEERFARETALREADMRLIAAAPELLAELIKLAGYAERLGARVPAARAAIAKAIGARA